jgi:hypothetical protein
MEAFSSAGTALATASMLSCSPTSRQTLSSMSFIAFIP